MPVVINLTAVLAAAVVNMVVGFLWYGPLFSKPWLKLVGLSQEEMQNAQKRGMGKLYFLAFIGALVMAYVLAHFVFYVGATTFVMGLELGFWIWLSFVATVLLGQLLWLNKPFKLYLIDTGYYLVVLVLTAGLLSVWR